MRTPAALLLALASLTLTAAEAKAAAPPAGAVAGAFEFPERPVWAGEVFDLTLAWRVNWELFQNMEGPLAWKSEPLVAEPWGEAAMRGTPEAGRATIDFKTRAMALQPGRVTLQPAEQVMVLKTGVVDMGDYQRSTMAPFPMRSARTPLTVRALPPPPPGFSGAVGQFTVESRVDKASPKVGDSLTWTVTLAGSGNWPAIRGLPPRQASRDFEIIGAPKLIEETDAKLFERTLQEAVVMIPQRSGRYTLGAFAVVVFDPAEGRYVTLAAPPIALDIQPGPNGDLIPPEQAAPRAANARPADTLPPMLKGKGETLPPPASAAWILGLALAPLAVAGLWLLLAWRRAWLMDPDRAARGAHARLAAGLQRLARSTDPVERRRLVRAWQSDAAVRLKLGRAAPAPSSFEDLEWRRLWVEADRFLYGRGGALPDDWAQRALERLSALGQPPPFAPATVFRPANLLPAACAAGLMIACLAPAPPARAASAPGVTEASLRQVLAGDPLDWRARHNLAVSLAARDRWDEAAGQAALAWVHKPQAAETRSLWLQTAGKAGYSLDAGASVPRPRGWRGRAIALASPAAWRWMGLAFGWLAAAGAAALIYDRFHRTLPHLRTAGAGLIAVAALGGAAAMGALWAYGPLSAKDAVLVWSAGPLRPLPVDTPAEAAPVQLAAGAVGRVERTFLGWRQVRLGDGRTGWLRREDLLWVWTRPQ